MLTNQEFEAKMKARGMTVEGAEVPDPRPIAPPVGYVKQPSMFETVRKMLAAEFARRKDLEDMETAEDAADMGEDDEDVVQALSTYERYDLELELARRADAEARASSDASTRNNVVGEADAPPDRPTAPPVAPAVDQ